MSKSPWRLRDEDKEEIRCRLLAGESVRSIAKAFGVDRAMVRYYRRRNGIPSAHEGYGHTGNKASVLALAEQGYSTQTIVERVGIGRATVRTYVRTWTQERQAAGLPIPPCRCGSPRNHKGNCIEKINRGAEARRLGRGTAQRQRPAARALRPVGRITSGIADALYNRIERLIPSGYARDIRDDIASELYLAVLSGEIPEDRIEQDGRRILNRVLDETGASWFGPTVSLDEVIGEDGFTLGHTIPCPESLVPYEERTF